MDVSAPTYRGVHIPGGVVLTEGGFRKAKVICDDITLAEVEL